MGARRATLTAVIVLLLAACGGGTEELDSDQTTTSTAAPATTEAGNGGGDQDDGDIIEQAAEQFENMVDTEGGSGTVTIGGETWEFQAFESVPTAACDADFFGGFFAVMTDGDDITVPVNGLLVTLPGGDFEDPPEVVVTVNVDGDTEWIADETIYERSPDLPEGIGVTSFTIEGTTASGTALFFDEESSFQFNAGLADEVTLAEGTFTVSCPAG